MKRLALVLSVLAASGCIYLTPPTGLRIGDHANEFANAQNGAVLSGTVQYDVYQSNDFSVPYPAVWGLGRTDVPSGKSTLRMSAGQRTTSGEAEGVIVTTVNDPLDADAAKAKAALSELVKGSLASSYTGFQVVAEKSATLGGVEGVELEATGKDPNNFDNHFLVRAAMHGGKGYIVVISTIESRYESLKSVFEYVQNNFAFKEGTAASPSPSASPDQQASPSASPASPSPSPSPSAK